MAFSKKELERALAQPASSPKKYDVAFSMSELEKALSEFPQQTPKPTPTPIPTPVNKPAPQPVQQKAPIVEKVEPLQQKTNYDKLQNATKNAPSPQKPQKQNPLYKSSYLEDVNPQNNQHQAKFGQGLESMVKTQPKTPERESVLDLDFLLNTKEKLTTDETQYIKQLIKEKENNAFTKKLFIGQS